VDFESLETEINEIFCSKREDQLSDLFLNWYKIPVLFFFPACFGACFGSAISGPAGHAKVPSKVPDSDYG